MSLTSQQYADLAKDSYKDYAAGIRKAGEEEKVPIGGVTYKVLEHYRNPRTDYEGTIYQRVDTGEIVVAHRGTEADRGAGSLIKDGAITDGSMVFNRVNPQKDDAIGLTQRAIDRANEIGRTDGQTPEVTVTGHSLGGTLAQITAHHFDLKGQTFNAYGATSLNLRIPQGGNDVINHAMSNDPVSAASPHYGQVRIYGTAQQITTLIESDYENDRDLVRNYRTPLVAASRSVGTHSMHNFTDEDGKGRPDRSILADPQARRLANDFDPMIDRFRDDLQLVRRGITVGSRGLPGLAGDAYDAIRGDLRPGEPAEREARNRPTPTPPPARPDPLLQPYDSQLFGPGKMFPELPDYVPKPVKPDGTPLMKSRASLDESPSSPATIMTNPQLAIDKLSPKDREVYDQTLRLAQQQGLPKEQAQNAAMVMTATVRDDPLMRQADRMVAVNDKVFASYHPHGDREPIFSTHIDLKQAANVPMEDSLRRIEQNQQQQLAQQQNQQQMQQDPTQDPNNRGQRMV